MACSRRYRGKPVVIVMALSINCHPHKFIVRVELDFNQAELWKG